MRNRQILTVALCALALGSCVTAPLSRTQMNSLSTITLSGYVPAKGDHITIQAVDQNTGTLVSLVPLSPAVSTAAGSVTHTTSAGTTYTMYPWSAPLGVLAPNLWSPQKIVGDLQTAQGHLELFASDGGLPFATYSLGAVEALMKSGDQLGISSGGFSDGNSTVLFDQYGTGNAAHGSWMNAAGMTMTPPGSFKQVAWSAGSYTVDNGKQIYALICTPTSGGPYPVVIYNHGGIDSIATPTGGDLFGAISGGWTTQPSNGVDSLGQCLDWAKRGWVFATTAYRGSSVNITSGGSPFYVATAPSNSLPEFCLGEVTDVLALTDLIENQTGGIAVGAPGHTVPIKISNKLFMFGYSHGGCVTYRAVEQGAPVTAFSVIEGFTDQRLTYLDARQEGDSTSLSAALSGAFQPGTTTTYQPDANGVMGYNWRSAHYFASRGDLAIQNFKSMPILIFHGDYETDVAPGLPPSPNPTSLSQAALTSPDIGASNIFIGPQALAPTSVLCISGAAGAPVSTLSAPNATCPISFTAMDQTDPCTNGAQWYLTLCAAVNLPLTPSPGQPVQQHYLVVYHNMSHINGGLGILATFNAWVIYNFGSHPGCDGLVTICASD